MSRHHDKHKMKGAKYERFRRDMLQRAGYRCECGCNKVGKWELHHIVRLEDGGDPWSPENVMVLTRACHLEVTRKENEQRINPDRLAWINFVRELTNP